MNSGGTRKHDELVLRAQNAVASVAVVLLACMCFILKPYHTPALKTLYRPIEVAFSGYQFVASAAATYSILLIAYFFSERDPAVSKTLRFFRVLSAVTRPMSTQVPPQ